MRPSKSVDMTLRAMRDKENETEENFCKLKGETECEKQK